MIVPFIRNPLEFIEPLNNDDRVFVELFKTLVSSSQIPLLRQRNQMIMHIIMHKFGLFGLESKPFISIAKILKLKNATHVSQLFRSGLVMLRHPSRKELVEKIQNHKILSSIKEV